MKKITDDKLVSFLKDKVCSFWKECDKKQLFPGVQPISMERKDFKTLKENPYVVCAKFDGERYFLLHTIYPLKFNSTKSIKKKISVLINRKFEFFKVLQNFADTTVYTKTTLFDGEFVNNQFIIHDTICIKGENLKTQQWEYRWFRCRSFLFNIYKYNENCSFQISLKHFFPINKIPQLLEHIKKNNIPQDGFIFYPMNEPIKFKTQWDLFKLKPPELHTVDFKINFISKNKCQLITWDKGKEIIYKILDSDIFSGLYSVKNGDVVEFKIKEQNFIPYKIRCDKHHSNNLFTIEKTMLNERENIKIDDIIKLFE